MKTLTNLKTTIEGDKVTITGTIVEKTFGFPSQQVTIGDVAPDNHQWVRHVQMSQEAIFIKRFGVGLAIPIQELIANVATEVEPRLTYAPILKKSSQPLSVEFSSELMPNLQWQESDTNELTSEWKDIPGATQKKLEAVGLEGKFVRCVASSPAGSCLTPVVKIPAIPVEMVTAPETKVENV